MFYWHVLLQTSKKGHLCFCQVHGFIVCTPNSFGLSHHPVCAVGSKERHSGQAKDPAGAPKGAPTEAPSSGPAAPPQDGQDKGECQKFLLEHEGIWLRCSDQDPVATWLCNYYMRCFKWVVPGLVLVFFIVMVQNVWDISSRPV